LILCSAVIGATTVVTTTLLMKRKTVRTITMTMTVVFVIGGVNIKTGDRQRCRRPKTPDQRHLTDHLLLPNLVPATGPRLPRSSVRLSRPVREVAASLRVGQEVAESGNLPHWRVAKRSFLLLAARETRSYISELEAGITLVFRQLEAAGSSSLTSRSV
jgi:hypothetical protein